MSETPQIDPNTTNALTAALRPWVQQALAYIKQRPDLTAELAKCMDGDRDVRIVFHTRGKAITVEACDYAAGRSPSSSASTSSRTMVASRSLTPRRRSDGSVALQHGYGSGYVASSCRPSHSASHRA